MISPQRTHAFVSPTPPHPGRHYQPSPARTRDRKERFESAAVDDAAVSTCSVLLETAVGTLSSSRTTPSTPAHTQTPATPLADRSPPAPASASENRVTVDGGGRWQRRRRRHRLGVRQSDGRRRRRPTPQRAGTPTAALSDNVPPPRARKMTRMSRYRLQRLATPPSASRTRRPQGQMGASGFEQTATSTPRHTRMSGTLVPDSTRPPSRPGRPDSAPPASLAPVSLALDLGACK